MKVYYIERPSVSNGLKRTYCKKLEVFSGEVDDTPLVNKYNNAQYYHFRQATSVYRYNIKKGLWIETPSTKYINAHIMANKIFDTAETNQTGLYTTLEAACVAKLLLIERMAESYKKELKALQELFERNVPDIQKPIDQLLEEHPDLFV